MELVFDLHTHSIVSGHAYSSFEENIRAGIKKGLKAYGISEHSYRMPGSVTVDYFFNFKVVPTKIDDMIVLMGVEANILDYEGGLDCTENMLRNMDYIIASLHTPIIDPTTEKENTELLIKVMNNPYVKIIGHPDDSRYPLDYDLLAKEAANTKTVLEVNNSSLSPNSYRQNAQENVRSLLKACMKYDAKVILNSDAHFSTDVGNFSNCIKVIEDMEFPIELIVNSSIDGLKYVLNDTPRLSGLEY